MHNVSSGAATRARRRNKSQPYYGFARQRLATNQQSALIPCPLSTHSGRSKLRESYLV